MFAFYLCIGCERLAIGEGIVFPFISLYYSMNSRWKAFHQIDIVCMNARDSLHLILSSSFFLSVDLRFVSWRAAYIYTHRNIHHSDKENKAPHCQYSLFRICDDCNRTNIKGKLRTYVEKRMMYTIVVLFRLEYAEKPTIK